MEATEESAVLRNVISFAIRENRNINLLRSISFKQEHSDPSFTPPRLSSPSLTDSTYKCISSVIKMDGQILSLAVSNTMAYTGSSSNVIRIWKLPEMTECGQLKSKTKMVVAIEVSDDRVFAAYGDCKIRVWSRGTCRGVTKHVRLATIPKIGGYVRSYISGKDKTVLDEISFVAVGHYEYAIERFLKSRLKMNMKHMAPISSLAMNLSDDIIYSASLDKTVKVWRISDLKCIETIQAHSAPINAIVLGEGILYTASDDATVKVWRQNFPSGHRPHTHTMTLPAKYSPVKTLTLNPDGRVLYGGCTDGFIHYWLRGSFVGQMQYAGSFRGHTHAVMCLTSVANFLVSGSADSTARLWSRDNNGIHSCVAVLRGYRGPIRSLAAFPSLVLDEGDDKSINICTGSMDGLLKVWRVKCNNTRLKSIGSNNFQVN
ncbi:WD repeat-containing protein tag-125-like protein [Heracleum sosnowskyi]|uniref:WD repeat-containing protein tag-125-like protein n=1 Tax=Heracleum sosnowskyi TaxID=360622 RepID=A0AAD8H4H0_9APIA|nr:WD repeat-containing protein tag-125-like protein [Heracleum sosnowskyi]